MRVAFSQDMLELLLTVRLTVARIIRGIPETVLFS